MRPKDKSDPDPKLATVILRIWPWMFLVTVANLVFLVLIAGLSGPLIFLALVICYAANHSALSYFCKVVKPAGDPEDGRETKEDNEEEEEVQSFIAMAALSSLWLPSVVGPQSQKIFLVSGTTSLISKVLLLTVVVTLSEEGLLTSIHPKPFLLSCLNNNPPHLNETKFCHFSEHNVSEGDCFLGRNKTHEKELTDLLSDLKILEEYNRVVKSIDADLEAKNIENALFKNKSDNTFPDLIEVKRLIGEVEKKIRASGKLPHKVRICQKDETLFRLYILSGLLVVIALAAYATYRLHRIADYRVFGIKRLKYQYLFNCPQELFDSSKTVLGCIPSDKFRVIHRSLLFDALEERQAQRLPLTEEQEKNSLLVQILDSLKASEENTHVTESSKNKEEENVDVISENLVPMGEIKEEQNVKESSKNPAKENKEEDNAAQSSENLMEGNNRENAEESSENMIDDEEDKKNEETEKPFVEDKTDTKSEKISKIVAVLDKIEQVHRELQEANQDFKDPGVAKVGKMEDKIRKVKRNLGTNKKKDDLQLLDQPNAEGVTAIHISTSMDDDEATRMLLSHGANPNVQDADGNSPLHTICSQRDIQTATCIIKNNGSILRNNKEETPALDELFFDQEEKEIGNLMEAVNQSKHRIEIIDEILRKRQILFRLVEEDNSEILSIVLKKLNAAEQETYVNLVQDEKDQNSALHIATATKKSPN